MNDDDISHTINQKSKRYEIIGVKRNKNKIWQLHYSINGVLRSICIPGENSIAWYRSDIPPPFNPMIRNAIRQALPRGFEPNWEQVERLFERKR